jgi:hypothetical protein
MIMKKLLFILAVFSSAVFAHEHYKEGSEFANFPEKIMVPLKCHKLIGST